jgi:flavin-dependent dehydrogenase
MIDLLVAGAGPAGLVTALYAKRAGLTVEVIEPRPTPIDKACGEGLMPGARRALADLGISVPGQDIRGIRYVDAHHSVDAAFRCGAGAGVRRTALHEALDRARRAAGIRLHARRVADVWSGSRSVCVDGVEARYLVAADGLHSPIRHRLGLDVPDHAPRRWGLRAHFPVTPWTDHVEVHWSPDGEAYVTPVAADCVGVAVLTAHRRDFSGLLRSFPSLAARLPSPDPTAVRGAGPLRQRVRRRVAGRVLLVGDAAGYVDALTGEGLAVAFATAHELVRAIAADDPSAYEAAWRRTSRRYRAITASLVWLARREAVHRRIVPTATALPGVFAVAVNQLAR